MKQTHQISVVIDHSDPVEKVREDARIAARTLFDAITGGATEFLLAAAYAHKAGDEAKADALMAEYHAASLCPKE